ncbi:hypothetical protein B0F90DRAFT_1800090 [Multifurca ochricompacta]|uniref:Uncharacterized protein n=1 Tax=Multifurca ochricompacta TaxID=376703 RepID=A0AAD4LSS2_9AGAM|nr:hypothetical protein B0F90DRAFT_1800090 [Multifurca ochricompacta]
MSMTLDPVPSGQVDPVAPRGAVTYRISILVSHVDTASPFSSRACSLLGSRRTHCGTP